MEAPTRRRTEDAVVGGSGAVGFDALCLPDAVLAGVRACGYVHPSPVQLAAVPPALAGADCIVQAKSGTGKTCAFGVVVLARTLADATAGSALLREPGRCKAVVVEPTRELAAQTAAAISALGACVPRLRVARFIGGLPLAADVAAAREGRTDIVVGTPGRLQDVLCHQRALDSSAVAVLVVDEADRIEGDPPLRASLRAIQQALCRTSHALQTLAFSATFTDTVVRALAANMRSPRLIRPASAGTNTSINKTTSSTSSSSGVDSASAIELLGVSHFVVEVEHESASSQAAATTPQARAIAAFEAKARLLALVLDGTEFNQCLVFCNSKQWGCLLSEWLCQRGWPAAFIGGGAAMAQSERLQVMDEARRFQVRLLVSTDLIARGVDLERVNLVVNFDLPAIANHAQHTQQGPEQQQQQQQKQHEKKEEEDSGVHAAIHTYFHRAGRTGRFGTLGVVVSLYDAACANDVAFLCALEQYKQQPLRRLDVAHGEALPRELYACALETRAEQEALSEFQTARAMAVHAATGKDAHDEDAQSLAELLGGISEEAAKPQNHHQQQKQHRAERPRKRRRSTAPTEEHQEQEQEQEQQEQQERPMLAPPFWPVIPWGILDVMLG